MENRADMIVTPVRYMQRSIQSQWGSAKPLTISEAVLPLDYHCGILGVSRSEENPEASKWNYKLDIYLDSFLKQWEGLRRDVINKSETTDVQLNEAIQKKFEEKNPVLLNMIKGITFMPIHFCKDSSCRYILEKDEELCPNSLDHAGWKEEGLLREVASRIERALPLLGASTNEIKTLKNFIKSQSNYEIENVKIIIQKYAPFELLTTGWGQEEEKREKKKEKREYDVLDEYKPESYAVWKKIDECPNPKKIAYLIYKKGEENS